MTFRYAIIPTPIGDAVSAFSGEGLVALRIAPEPEWALESVSRELRGALLPDDGSDAAEELAAQLEAYFAGERRRFDVALDWRLVAGFTREALEAVREIPYGATAAYGEVAAMAGRPRAARAVGTACRTTPYSLVVPVHRVVRADGTIGGYGGDEDVKRFLIELEQDALAPGRVPHPGVDHRSDGAAGSRE
ncbi:methylated-DNA--[protein]-cysteine S-methyltransferase [Microbacterium betulae]|uniref:methylated-DNA--[protein]-cysteine S-methyltransferase n=1 Tax=Microbacterium betulae TaxID=2981139 RepID=A0AA97I5M3_9MICO|nr:methylated-DNA--[protein]-cysteine S-methyltransferase [Microbacterium sp. AB]WOF23896.1 methylated-DNA--[protein]-cysteine S-methyltransferase [Microbacterium sp. AB]